MKFLPPPPAPKIKEIKWRIDVFHGFMSVSFELFTESANRTQMELTDWLAKHKRLHTCSHTRTSHTHILSLINQCMHTYASISNY